MPDEYWKENECVEAEELCWMRDIALSIYPNRAMSVGVRLHVETDRTVRVEWISGSNRGTVLPELKREW